MVMSFEPYFKLGGLIHMAFHLYPARVHMWVDVITSQFDLLHLHGKVDIKTYNETCGKVFAKSTNMRVRINMQFDFNECLFGAFGSMILDPIDCTWRQYFIKLPLLDEGFVEWDNSWELVKERCLITADYNVFTGIRNALKTLDEST